MCFNKIKCVFCLDAITFSGDEYKNVETNDYRISKSCHRKPWSTGPCADADISIKSGMKSNSAP